MIKEECILITGASGFLGTWLATAAYERGWKLIGCDIVQPRRPEIFAAFANHSCDRVDFAALIGERKLHAVFHLAGSASVPQSIENPIGDFTSLLPGTISLLAYLVKNERTAHLISFSSAAVYGNPIHLPIKESASIAPISPYGIHKAAAESLIRDYARVFALRATILRVFSAFGEGLRKQILWDICQKALLARRTRMPSIILHGTGEETRDFIHARDIAGAALLVISKPPPPTETHTLNVASGVETSVRALAESALSALDMGLRLEFNGAARPGDPGKWRADIGELCSFGFSQTMAIGKGVEEYVAWLRAETALSENRV